MTALPGDYNKNEFESVLLDCYPDGILITNEDNSILEVNTKACLMMGYGREELLNLSVRDLIPDFNRTSILAEFSGLEETGNFSTLVQVLKKNNRLLHVRMNAVKTTERKHIIFITDISEFKQIEERLLNSMQQLRMITDNIPVLVSRVNAHDFSYKFVNKSFAHTYDISPENIIGRHIRDVIGEEAYMCILPYIERAKSGENLSYESIMPVHGDPRRYIMNYIPELDENRTVIDIIILMFDITAQKMSEEILKESEYRYRMLFEQSPDLNVIISKEGIVTEVSTNLSEHTGYQPEEMIGLHFTELPNINNGDIENFQSLYKNASEGQQFRELEIPLHNKNGMTVYFEAFINPIMAGGVVKLFQLILRNITKRKKAEDDLRISEEKFRFIVDNSMMPMIIASLKDYTVIFYNSFASEYFIDTSPAGTVKANDYWVHPHERNIFISILNEKGYVYGYEAELKTRDGRYKWSLLSAKIINYLGEPASFVMLNDITELKSTQKALLESENRFHRLAENARDMIYRMSLPDGKYEYVNASALDITGYTPQEFLEGYVNPQKMTHPDSLEYYKREWSNLLKGNMPPFYEYKIIHKNGSKKWLNQRNVLIQDEKGSPIAIEGLITDVTERKNAEEEKEKLIDELKKALTDVKKLSGLLPICASCKKIRNDKGYWEQIEEYIRNRSEADFSHGICPDCVKKLYPGLYKEK